MLILGDMQFLEQSEMTHQALPAGVLSSNYGGHRKGGGRTPGRRLLQFTRNPSVPGEYLLSILGAMKLHLKKK